MSKDKGKGTGLPPLSPSQISRINAIITGRASARYIAEEQKLANKNKNKKARGGRAKTRKK